MCIGHTCHGKSRAYWSHNEEGVQGIRGIWDMQVASCTEHGHSRDERMESTGGASFGGSDEEDTWKKMIAMTQYSGGVGS